MRGPAFGSVHLETDWPATVQRHPTAPAATSDGHRSLIATDSDSNDETSSAREDSCVPALPSIDWFWVELWRGGGGRILNGIVDRNAIGALLAAANLANFILN